MVVSIPWTLYSQMCDLVDGFIGFELHSYWDSEEAGADTDVMQLQGQVNTFWRHFWSLAHFSLSSISLTSKTA